MRSRDDRFQQWQALLANRRTRTRLGRFLIQGVQPITAAVSAGWPLDALLHRPGPRSSWAQGILDGPAPAARIELPAPMLAELGGRDDGPPELVAVGVAPPDDLDRIPTDADLLLIGDRTASPGNLGTMIRTADALGAAAVVVTGHAADPYDPQAVRASRGSLFALPVVRARGPEPVVAWLGARGQRMKLVGTSEESTVAVWARDWRSPAAVVVGNEAAGMSRAWIDACDELVAIPQTGSATSLNAAASAAIVLYEARRQRWAH